MIPQAILDPAYSLRNPISHTFEWDEPEYEPEPEPESEKKGHWSDEVGWIPEPLYEEERRKRERKRERKIAKERFSKVAAYFVWLDLNFPLLKKQN